VSAVKLLADVDAFSRDDGCPVCAEAAAEAEAHAEENRELLTKLVVGAVVEILEDSPHPIGLTRMAKALLDENQSRRIAELHTLRLEELRASWTDEVTREAFAPPREAHGPVGA
jgi:hypothetical protein